MLNTYCVLNTAGEKGENQTCNLRFQKLSHPDLHFAYYKLELKCQKQSLKH
jgi:hypothetical protein